MTDANVFTLDNLQRKHPHLSQLNNWTSRKLTEGYFDSSSLPSEDHDSTTRDVSCRKTLPVLRPFTGNKVSPLAPIELGKVSKLPEIQPEETLDGNGSHGLLKGLPSISPLPGISKRKDEDEKQVAKGLIESPRNEASLESDSDETGLPQKDRKDELVSIAQEPIDNQSKKGRARLIKRAKIGAFLVFIGTLTIIVVIVKTIENASEAASRSKNTTREDTSNRQGALDMQVGNASHANRQNANDIIIANMKSITVNNNKIHLGISSTQSRTTIIKGLAATTIASLQSHRPTVALSSLRTQPLSDMISLKVTQLYVSPSKVTHSRDAGLESIASTDGLYLLSSIMDKVDDREKTETHDVTQLQCTTVTQLTPFSAIQSRTPGKSIERSSVVTRHVMQSLNANLAQHTAIQSRLPDASIEVRPTVTLLDDKINIIRFTPSMPMSRNTIIRPSSLLLKELDGVTLSRSVSITTSMGINSGSVKPNGEIISSGIDKASLGAVQVSQQHSRPNSNQTVSPTTGVALLSRYPVTERHFIVTQSSALVLVIQRVYVGTESSGIYRVHNAPLYSSRGLEEEVTQLSYSRVTRMSRHPVTVTQTTVQTIQHVLSRTETHSSIYDSNTRVNDYRTSASLQSKIIELRDTSTINPNPALSVSVTHVRTISFSVTESVTPNRCQEGQYKRHPIFCTFFMHCSHGKWFQQSCGPGTVFNPAKNVCDWIRNVRC